MKSARLLAMGLVVSGLVACASTRPVLYPNTHYLSVGKNVAERDIEDCIQLAKAAGAKESGGRSGNVASSTVIGGGAGAASGAVGGAITGSPGTGAMVGAASGATYGFLRSILSPARSSQPNPAFANFVNRCLQEKGYEVTGWH